MHKYYKHAPVLHPGDNVGPTLSKSGDLFPTAACITTRTKISTN
jgi:hypothetical protein